MVVIAVLGSKKSGKTTTIEVLVKNLTLRGYRVAAMKHVSEPDFTIDTRGKDTWRYAQAGANIIVAVSSRELGIVRKIDFTELGFQRTVSECQSSADVVFLEGFRSLVECEPTVLKIVAIKTFEEAEEASKRFNPIIAFTGSGAVKAEGLGIPVVDVLKQPGELLEIILSHL